MALSGEVQPGLGDMQGSPDYAPLGGSPMVASFGTFQPIAPPPVPNGVQPAPPAVPPGAGALLPAWRAQTPPSPPPPDPNSVRPDWLQTGTWGGCWLGRRQLLQPVHQGLLRRVQSERPTSPILRPPQRRALPESWPSPPFPGHEFQGYPLVGVPPSNNSNYPLMKALQGTWLGDWLHDNKIDIYGWVTAEGNISTSKNSNQPDSYWIVPNRIEMDQAVLRFERQADTVQTDHIDWGFRFTNLYGIDYRYLVAGGYFSQQSLLENLLYGYDPTEIYGEVYIPWVMNGMVVRIGRWIACPDIETQFAPDNYMGSHSLLFTYDTYTQTGIMLTFCVNDQWMFQVGHHRRHRHGPLVSGRHADRLPRPALGLQGQQRFDLHLPQQHQQRPSSARSRNTANSWGTTTSTTS